MKKSTTKSIKSPAPATKSVPSAKPVTTVKPAEKAKLANTASAPKTKAPFASKATLAPAATVPPFAPVAPKRPVTTITALVDVGFGNTLYLRGEGPGLSWEKGVPLDSLSSDKWAITFTESARPVIFKFLLNDISWSAGEDYTVAPGTSITVTPVF
ncbi:MAG TPA: hypothetical protein VHO24_03695 [Opitutaceae bacterium]|nr:hypothetical protein [Opitutaceae bacterium]